MENAEKAGRPAKIATKKGRMKELSDELLNAVESAYGTECAEKLLTIAQQADPDASEEKLVEQAFTETYQDQVLTPEQARAIKKLRFGSCRPA